jgi:hypothetical protein
LTSFSLFIIYLLVSFSNLSTYVMITTIIHLRELYRMGGLQNNEVSLKTPNNYILGSSIDSYCKNI